MLSSGLNEYSKENKMKIIIEKLSQVYGEEKLSLILDKAIEIDSEKSVYEIQESDMGSKKSNNTRIDYSKDER